MRRERVERDVGDHAELGNSFFTARTARLRDSVGVPGLARVQALLLDRRDGNKRDRRDPEPHQTLAFAQQLIDRQPVDSRHRSDRLALAAAVDDENRVDQRIDGQVGFAHQTARKLVAAHAPHAGIAEMNWRTSGHLCHDSCQ